MEETLQLDPSIDALYKTIPLVSLGGLNLARTAHGELPNTRKLDSAKTNSDFIHFNIRRDK